MALGGLVVSLTLGFLAYSLSRAYLLDKRIDLVRQEATLRARMVAGAAAPEPTPPSSLLQGLGSTDQPILVRSGEQWFGSVVGIGRRDVPTDLAQLVDGGTAAVAFTRIGGDPVAVVGIPLPGADRALYQFIPLVELAATLAAIRNALVVAAAVTTAGSAAYGLVMSGRVLRPLGETASAARRIAGGDMAARLDDHGDPDLVPLVESFNDMAAALDARIERERRFAADVSHELRTPLTALAAAVRIVERRSDELGPSGREAVEVLRSQTDQFTRLVLEILDLSRLEAGIADIQSELVDLRAAFDAMTTEAGLDRHTIHLSEDIPERVVVDPRRLRVTVRNLLENADRYGGGLHRADRRFRRSHVDPDGRRRRAGSPAGGARTHLRAVPPGLGGLVGPCATGHGPRALSRGRERPGHGRHRDRDRRPRRWRPVRCETPGRGRHHQPVGRRAGAPAGELLEQRGLPGPAARADHTGDGVRVGGTAAPSHRRPGRRRARAAVTAMVAGIVAACGVPDGGMTAIDPAELPPELRGVTTTSSPVTEGGDPAVAAVHWIRDRRLVREAVLFESGPSAARLLALLERGPVGSAPGDGARSALSAGEVSVRSGDDGIVTVELQDFDDPDQVLAVGQVVLTLTSLPGVDAVRFVRRNTPVEVPLPDGTLVARDLTEDDYLSLLDTSSGTSR